MSRFYVPQLLNDTVYCADKLTLDAYPFHCHASFMNMQFLFTFALDLTHFLYLWDIYWPSVKQLVYEMDAELFDISFGSKLFVYTTTQTR